MIDLFNLYKFAVDKKLVLQKGMIDSSYYHNIVNAAFAVKEYEWAELFIKKYTCFVQEKEQIATEHLCLAKLYFHKKEYTLASRLLLQLNPPTLFYTLQIKSLQLQIYNEMEDHYDLFQSHANSFTMLLRRNKSLSETQIEQYINFIKFTKKLYNLKFTYDKMTHKKLRANIVACTKLVNKNWLLEKADYWK